MKLKTCIIDQQANYLSQAARIQKDDLIDFLSHQSSRYGDKLVDFMETYDLPNLQEATIPQLQEYIAAHCYNLPSKQTAKSTTNATIKSTTELAENQEKML